MNINFIYLIGKHYGCYRHTRAVRCCTSFGLSGLLWTVGLAVKAVTSQIIVLSLVIRLYSLIVIISPSHQTLAKLHIQADAIILKKVYCTQACWKQVYTAFRFAAVVLGYLDFAVEAPFFIRKTCTYRHRYLCTQASCFPKSADKASNHAGGRDLYLTEL